MKLFVKVRVMIYHKAIIPLNVGCWLGMYCYSMLDEVALCFLGPGSTSSTRDSNVTTLRSYNMMPGQSYDLTHMSIIMLAFFIAYRSLHGICVLGTLNEYYIDKKQIL